METVSSPTYAVLAYLLICVSLFCTIDMYTSVRLKSLGAQLSHIHFLKNKISQNTFIVQFSIPNIALYASAPNHVLGQ